MQVHTEGGPGEASHVVSWQIYVETFRNLSFGTCAALWTLLTKVETSCDRILIAGGANVEAEWEQGPAV